MITLIGAGEEKNGILWFHSVIPVDHSFHTTKVDSYWLWHRREGHPTLSILRLFPGVNVGSGFPVELLE